MYNYSVIDKVDVNTNNVSCQGNEFPYDHPLIYLKISSDNEDILCPYCSRKFLLKNK